MIVAAAILVALAILLAPQLQLLTTHTLVIRDLKRRREAEDKHARERFERTQKEFAEFVAKNGMEAAPTPFGVAVPMQKRPEPEEKIENEDDELLTPRKPS